MSARKSKKSEQVETIKEEVMNTEAVVEVVEPEVSQEQIDKENRIVDLESEMVRLQDRIKDIRKELRGLESKTKREGPTKMELATQFWKDNPGLARKDYVAKFQSELGLTLAGSKTYIQLIMSKNK